jgi:hypothetical protein
MSVARLRLVLVGGKKFSPRAPFFRCRLAGAGDATAAATTPEEKEWGNLPVSPFAPSPAHGPQVGR